MPFLRRNLRLWLLTFLLGWTVTTLAVAAESKSLTAALESITSTELQAHVRYLANDSLEGREAGSHGGQLASSYLDAQLEALGLRAAGVDGKFDQPFGDNYRNILAVIPGSDPTLKQQYLVLSAHYDHIGYGTKRNSLGTVGQIHNGADDNASGTSGLLELAQALTMLPQPPRRSIVLAFWDAEEKGLLGSTHWAEHPTVPLKQVVLMLNMDMIGRLRGDRLVLMGSRTGYGLRRLICQDNVASDLLLDFPATLLANADHYPFAAHDIPSLTLHTDVHEDYHRPSDDADRINTAGMRRVTQLMLRFVYDMADRDDLPGFRQASRQETDEKVSLLPGKTLPVRLGVTWSGQKVEGRGVEVRSIASHSAAEKAGLKPGDRIVALDGREVASGEQLTQAVMSAASPTKAVVVPAGHEEPVEITVELSGRPLRLGLAWRVDDAEPGVVILDHIVPGSPADRAGLKAEDRIYQVGSRDFANETEFARLIGTLPGPLEVLVERRGRLRRAVLHFGTATQHRAG